MHLKIMWDFYLNIPGASEVELPPNKKSKHILVKYFILQLFLQDFNTYK